MISTDDTGSPSPPASDSSSGNPPFLSLSDAASGRMPIDEDLALLLSLDDTECESPPPSPGCVCLGSPSIWERRTASVMVNPSHAVAGGDRSGCPVDVESSGCGIKQPRVSNKSSSDLQVMSAVKIPAPSYSKGDGNVGFGVGGEVPPFPEPELHAAPSGTTGGGELKEHKRKSAGIPNHGIINQNAASNTSSFETTGSGELKGHKRKSEDIPNHGIVNQIAASETSLQVRKLPASLAKSQAEDGSAAVPPALSDNLPLTLMDCINILAAHRKPEIDMRALADLDILEVLKLKGIDLLPPSKASKKL